MIKTDTRFSPRAGFLLQELVVGLVIFGIAMYPILRTIVLLPKIAAAADVQARGEMWRSANDGFIGQGIDSNHTASLQHVAVGLEAGSLQMSSARLALAAQVGAPQITLLSEQGVEIADARGTPLGIEIGAATLPAAPRTDPLAPLPAVRLSVPSLSPASGAFVNVLTLALGEGVYATKLQSNAAASADRVFIKESSPDTQLSSSVGDAALMMPAEALAHGFIGASWSEFAGNQETDTRVALGDGRARWLVKAGQQVQVYEPSEFVDFIYGVDLGRPVFDFAGAEFASGSDVSVNFARAKSVAEGVTLAVIAYPAEVKVRFGAVWDQIAPSFKWSFGNNPGDSSSGNTASLFSDAGRNLWTDSQTLTADPESGLAGVRSWAGTWTLIRDTIQLNPPERESSFYDASTDEAGAIDFSAPVLPQVGLRIGRPKIDAIESTGNTLSVPLVP
jgi:hypothetical protein